jgi:hypothetical protein
MNLNTARTALAEWLREEAAYDRRTAVMFRGRKCDTAAEGHELRAQAREEAADHLEALARS